MGSDNTTDPRLVRIRENLAARGWTTPGHGPRQPYEVWSRGNGQYIDGVLESILVPVDPSRGDYEHLMARAYRLAGDVLVIPVEGTSEYEALADRLVDIRWRKTWPYGCRLDSREEAAGKDQVRAEVRATLAALREVARDA